MRQGVERLRHRRVVRRVPGPPDPAGHPSLLGRRPSTAEVQRVAAKGAKAVSFTESPHAAGLPSWHTDHWDNRPRRRPGRRPAAVPPLRLRRRAERRARGELHRRDRAVRHQLSVHDDRAAALAGLPQVPAPEGRALRGRHRLDAVHARAHRLHVGASPPLHGLQPRRPAVGAVPPAHLRLLHLRRRRRRRSAPHRRRQHHVRERLPALRQQLAVQPGRPREDARHVPDDEARKIAEDNTRRVFNFPRN